jgi:hypothetical protein
MHGDAQVEGLQATAAGVAVGEGLAHLIEDLLVGADRAADHQAAGVFQGLADALAPGTSPTPVWPALSLRITMLRVKNGPWAPLRLSSMLSWPATGQLACR